MIPRPVRNNNPGDLEVNTHGAHWLGLKDPRDFTAAQKAEPRFAVFASPEMGFRALVILLRNYQRIYECRTVNAMLMRFAPPVENATAVYAGHVAYECGVGAGETIDVEDREFMFKLAKSIAKYETGSWEPYWHDAQLTLGIGLTGLYPTERIAA